MPGGGPHLPVDVQYGADTCLQVVSAGRLEVRHVDGIHAALHRQNGGAATGQGNALLALPGFLPAAMSAEWQNGRTAERQNGRMAEWQNGRFWFFWGFFFGFFAERQNGRGWTGRSAWCCGPHLASKNCAISRAARVAEATMTRRWGRLRCTFLSNPRRTSVAVLRSCASSTMMTLRCQGEVSTASRLEREGGQTCRRREGGPPSSPAGGRHLSDT